MRFTLHTAVVLAISASSLACAGPFEKGPLDHEISLEGHDLIGFLVDHVDGGFHDHNATFDVAPFDDEPEDGCASIAATGVTFDTSVAVDQGGTLPPGVNPYSGEVAAPSCGEIKIFVDAAPLDAGGNATLVVDSGGGRARWIGDGFFTERRIVPLDPLNNVVRGSSVRFQYQSASDVITSLKSVEMRARGMPVTREDDIITVTIPEDAPVGAQTLSMMIEFEIPNITCEGFSSCLVEGEHFETIPLTIAP